jgi:putative tryptophan/tyrosine transport system substrate-binding protein
MRRREFITLLGGAAIAWPLAARAQQLAIPVIGFLHTASPGPFVQLMAAFRHSLAEVGFVEGQNLAIEYRWAEGQTDRLPALATDLMRRQVGVIVAVGGELPALAAKAVTSTIPIVFSVGGDPVVGGLVASFNHPGGNLTGLTYWTESLEAKRIGLLHELVPKAQAIAVMFDPNIPGSELQAKEAQAAAAQIGVQSIVLSSNSEREFDQVFATLARERVGALLIGSSSYFNNRRVELIVLAARHQIPTIYEVREFADAGGLLSYGPSLTDGYHQVGVYAGRILKGTRPSDLPVVQPTRFELVINLKTARALGLDVPPTLLARADDVIE